MGGEGKTRGSAVGRESGFGLPARVAVFLTQPSCASLCARDGRLLLTVSREILDKYQRVGEALAVKFPNIHLKPIQCLRERGWEHLLVCTVPHFLLSRSLKRDNSRLPGQGCQKRTVA